MKKFNRLALVVSIMAVFLAAGCDSSSDKGGAGADFDATLYYTKTEVDNLLLDVVQTGGNTVIISDTGYANAETISNVPEGATGVLVKIYGYNTSGAESFVLGISIGTSESVKADAYHGQITSDYYMQYGYVSFASGTTSLKVWQNTGLGGTATSLTGCTVNVVPQVWFK